MDELPSQQAVRHSRCIPGQKKLQELVKIVSFYSKSGRTLCVGGLNILEGAAPLSHLSEEGKLRPKRMPLSPAIASSEGEAGSWLSIMKNPTSGIQPPSTTHDMHDIQISGDSRAARSPAQYIVPLSLLHGYIRTIDDFAVRRGRCFGNAPRALRTASRTWKKSCEPTRLAKLREYAHRRTWRMEPVRIQEVFRSS